VDDSASTSSDEEQATDNTGNPEVTPPQAFHNPVDS